MAQRGYLIVTSDEPYELYEERDKVMKEAARIARTRAGHRVYVAKILGNYSIDLVWNPYEEAE